MTRNRSYKGFVPAAGFGSRLRPLTNHIAKPALPILGVKSSHIIYTKLEQAGINQIATNSHHLSDQIKSMTDEYPLDIHLSWEPNILGSGGCYPPIESWRSGSDLLVYNSDVVICDINLNEYIRMHERSHATVTFALLPYSREGTPPVYIDKDLNVLSLGDRKPPGKDLKSCYGMGIFLLGNEFFKFLKKYSGSFNILNAYNDAIDAGEPMKAYLHEGYWFDQGETPSDYLDVNLMLLNEPNKFSHTIDDIKRAATRLGMELELDFSKRIASAGKLTGDENIQDCVFSGPTYVGGSRSSKSIFIDYPKLTAEHSRQICIGSHTFRV